MRRKLFLATAIILAVATSASAETFTYACEVEKDHDHYHVVKLDLASKTITWYGSTYRHVKQFTHDCAKECFSGTDEEDGTKAVLSVATQGVASLDVQVPGSDKVETFDCSLVEHEFIKKGRRLK